jgi:hypothetical protein
MPLLLNFYAYDSTFIELFYERKYAYEVSMRHYLPGKEHELVYGARLVHFIWFSVHVVLNQVSRNRTLAKEHSNTDLMRSVTCFKLWQRLGVGGR